MARLGEDAGAKDARAMSGRNRVVDWMRFGANVLIVVYHAYLGTRIGECAWAVGMATLCLISGWCCFRDFERGGELGAWWSGKIARRVKRLLIPYLVWGAAFVGLYWVMARTNGEAARRLGEAGVDGMAGAIKAVFNFTGYVLYGPLWFLRMLFVCAILAGVWGAAFKRLKGAWALGAAILIGAGASFGARALGLEGYGTWAIVLYGAGAWCGAERVGVGVGEMSGRDPAPLSYAVTRWVLPTGMFVYILHLAVLRVAGNVVLGVVVPMVAWHVLNLVWPKGLRFLEGRW